LALAAQPGYDPKTDGRYGEDAGEDDKPDSEVRDGIISRLFPKAVLKIFLIGGAFGLMIVGGVLLWGHIQYAPDKTSSQCKTHD
jgi:hypothetical protein